MRLRLDRTVCRGFGVCGLRSPETFSLDEWGYAALREREDVPVASEPGVRRAIEGCPVHAITTLEEETP